MSSAPVLSLTRNGEPLHNVTLSSLPGRQEATGDINELQICGFEIESREPDTEYGLWIGDVEAGLAVRHNDTPASTIGVARGSCVLWDDALYFEGARGAVTVRLCSRPIAGKSTWKDRAFLTVVVSSSKLSADRYATILEQMSGLAAGLVLDLISKTLRSLRVTLRRGQSQIRTSAVELRLLEAIWPIVAANLRMIDHAPEMRLRRKVGIRNCWGSERLDARALATLVLAGTDPRLRSSVLPFRAEVGRIEESYDTFEHRVIRGFLDLLHDKTCECRENIVRHIESIERDRRWRDRPGVTGDSLYANEDVPRIERLRQRLARTRELAADIDRARRTPWIASVQPIVDLTPTPVFSNVAPYRRIRHELLEFLRSGLITVDEGADERIKSTSRLFEQWVFLQCAAAFRLSGLRCISQQGILRESRMFRFTLDLDRGARATFVSRDGRAVVLRYEPWVLPRPQAIQNRDTVYRGRGGATAWSPDLLIEFLAGPERAGRPAEVEYAIVVDAKYVRAIRESHWTDTSKYLEIRSSATDRQIVRQHWLAFPGADEASDHPLQLRDASVKWTENGPDCAIEEIVQGVIAVAPQPRFVKDSISEGWISTPEPPVRLFVSGLLRYMRFVEGQ